jgi:hypothetical protein
MPRTHHLRAGLVAAAAIVLSGPALAQPSALPTSSGAREAEANAAERWALYGAFVPIGAATAIAIVTNPSENDVPAPVLGTIGGLWALGGLWGVSAGYYRAGRVLEATLLGLGKTALLGSCVLVDRALADSGPSGSTGMQRGGGVPLLTVLAVGGIVVWDVVDYLRLGRSIRERPPGVAVLPAIVASDRLAALGLSGRF